MSRESRVRSSWPDTVATEAGICSTGSGIRVAVMVISLSDEAAGKLTLLVRLGRRRGANIHNWALLAAIGLGALGTFLGLPVRVALAVVISSPLVLLQIATIRRMQRAEPVSFARLTFVAVLIFILTAYFMAFSFWALRA